MALLKFSKKKSLAVLKAKISYERFCLEEMKKGNYHFTHNWTEENQASFILGMKYAYLILVSPKEYQD